MLVKRPDHSEAAQYYFTYISRVGDGDIRQILHAQRDVAMTLFGRISEDQAGHRYQADKWSIRQVVSHINDAERLFVFRAFWFGRGLDAPLESWDQDVAIKYAGADARTWKSHVDEFAAVRASTLAFFDNLPDDAWTRRGVASGNPFTVGALAYITAGHAEHHLGLLRDRYL